ncbi:MAG: flagellar basal body L-ring protein FlgH [Deltaproteobacteria bacterium]|nr:flagellar basal body L-ring protein FlgH [Deltaproteobacteria bacterium]MBW2085351.1 flagellar basal body L-ring protein FlgH [Deltaproteobacteria bacterium]
MKNKQLAAFIVLTALLVIMAGCGSGAALTISPRPEAKYIAPILTQPAPVSRTEGSLFSQTVMPAFYRDLKAYRVGDIVTINIVETSKASKQANTQTGKEYELSAGISALLGYQDRIPHNPHVAFNPSSMLGAKYSSSFKGSGQTTRKEDMTAQMSARVVQILPNGDLSIRGTREITVNHEKQYIILEGIIRPTDISSDNTILSTYIADARISYTGKGVISAKQRPGWLARLLDHVWPF